MMGLVDLVDPGIERPETDRLLLERVQVGVGEQVTD
jgi:hypothetical protein